MSSIFNRNIVKKNHLRSGQTFGLKRMQFFFTSLLLIGFKNIWYSELMKSSFTGSQCYQMLLKGNYQFL